MDWFFPGSFGGRVSGFHDAGVETFKGDFDRYLARELIQNSLDAHGDPGKPVVVTFQLLQLERSRVPGMDELQEAFTRCAEYWKDHDKARSFFEAAACLAAQPRLSALVVSDSNTTGVPGKDDERDKNWYHLVRCAGSSPKWGGEGGSFGIGKNAPFAASRLRTVFYSTMTNEGDVAFQGVSTLASHPLPDGSVAQPTGFLGGHFGESIRSQEEIPLQFRRSEPGLHIVVLEYPWSKGWQRALLSSVLDNFWPAIDFGNLEVVVGSTKVDKSNLAELLSEFATEEGFTAHFFHRAHRAPSRSFVEKLPTLKECRLTLLAGEDDSPRSVAMVRRAGMVIEHRKYFRSLVPFCGVFICRNDEGNRVLREMEPPRHDKWDPNHPDKGENRRVELEFMTFIRECIKMLAPADDSKVTSIPDLDRYLPDDEDTEESFGDTSSSSPSETADRSPLPERIPGRAIDPTHRSMRPDMTAPDDGEHETEWGQGDGSGGGSGKGADALDGGAGAGGGGVGQGDSAPHSGAHGGVHSKPATPVRYRTFVVNADRGLYSLLVVSDGKGDQPAYLVVSTVGDDQRAPADIASARLASGQGVPIVGPGVLGPLRLSAATPLRIEVELSSPDRVAMEVAAYEAEQ